MTTHPLLQIDNLTKVFRGGVKANDDISFNVTNGSIVGLLGHNGAGKTTLLNQVIGLARPTSGSIHVNGADALADPRMAREVCSFQPQTQAPLDNFTPRQAIEVVAQLRGARTREAKARASHLLRELDIEAWADRRGQDLSGGVKRLTLFCMTVAQPGQLVMLDEPTNDVDPVRRRLLWRQIRALSDNGHAVLLVTHNVVEAERAVDSLIILDEGKVIAEGTPAMLRERLGHQLRVEIVAASPEDAHSIAKRYDGVVTGQRVVAPVDIDQSSEILSWAHKQQLEGAIEEFSITPVGLEDIYIDLSESSATAA
ncbi:ABC transporter ATP-binding protein [Natronoglycomyces albus]|uniref:ABC transporter ATP-binding protein n=1 Tax=Natronoglycomyces albus TaxID=2811108 RepID=A0A895XMX1_9ACTN|nr:ABC transporter ATP-binding protein [Natronoglycomyces albus]QSB06704.1 ABC transporter ATP-binding protein [Natronoglycomyces albus]